VAGLSDFSNDVDEILLSIVGTEIAPDVRARCKVGRPRRRTIFRRCAMKFPVYRGLLHHAETALGQSFRQVADGHGDEPDVRILCRSLADQCDRHTAALGPIIARYGEARAGDELERLHADGLSHTRSGGLGLLRDLQDLYLLASFVDITWIMIKQAGQGLRDTDLLAVVTSCDAETAVQLQWIRTRMNRPCHRLS
jgi:hypothetical protein